MQIVEPPQAGGPRFDHGPILLASPPVPIPPRATVQSLTAILAQIGARLTLDVLDRVDDYLVAARSQTPSPESLTITTLSTCSPYNTRSPIVATVSPSSAPKLKRERAEINFAKQTAAEIDCSARALAGRFALCAYIGHTPIKLSSPLSPQLVRQLLPFCIPAVAASSCSAPQSPPVSDDVEVNVSAHCVQSAARSAPTGPTITTAPITSVSALPAGAVLFSRYPSRSRHRQLPTVPLTAPSASSVVSAPSREALDSNPHAAADADTDADASELDGALLVRCSDGGFVGFGRVQIVASRGQPTRRPLSAREFANGYLRDRRSPLLLAWSPPVPQPDNSSVAGGEISGLRLSCS